jgi:thymidylate synthase (FAD)
MPPSGWYSDPLYGGIKDAQAIYAEAEVVGRTPAPMKPFYASDFHARNEMKGEPIDVTTLEQTPQASHLVLDHGYVRLVEHWGSDERIIEAARMSTGKGFEGWGPKHEPTCNLLTVKTPGLYCSCNVKAGDERLLAYLWHHKHTTPFEMAGAAFEVQAPIFVFREWHRHRTQSYNEASARYAPLPAVDYTPTVERIRLGGGHITKQAASAGERLHENQIDYWLLKVAEAYAAAENAYQLGLNTGIPKELARIVMPVGRYSKMRASANLLNWTRFLQLRLAENAQWEIRQYAQAVYAALSGIFPRTMALFKEGGP